MVRREGIEPSSVTPGRLGFQQQSYPSFGLELLPPGPRRNATPHQTHALTTIALFISSSLISENEIPITSTRRPNPNPNEISTAAFTLAFSPKLCRGRASNPLAHERTGSEPNARSDPVKLPSPAFQTAQRISVQLRAAEGAKRPTLLGSCNAQLDRSRTRALA